MYIRGQLVIIFDLNLAKHRNQPLSPSKFTKNGKGFISTSFQLV